MLEQRLAGGRQLHLPSGAFEQLHAGALLKLANLAAQCLLSHVQALGGPREVQLLGHGDKRPQVPQLDVHGGSL